MDLFIVVTGLVLMVPDSVNDKLYLIFPETAGMSHVDRHYPMIRYTDESGNRIDASLEDWDLDLSELGRPGLQSAPHKNVMALGSFGFGIDRTRLLSTSDANIQGRVILPFPDKVDATDSASWRVVIGGVQTSVTLTNSVQLVYRFNRSDSAMWLRRAYGSGTATSQLPLPNTQKAPLRIEISSLAIGIDTPAMNKEAKHFQAYLPLLNNVPASVRVILDQEPPPDWEGVPIRLDTSRISLDPGPPFPSARLFPVLGHTIHVGASPYNCMLAWAPVVPPE